MLRVVAGLVGAVVAGAWLGATTEYLSESGGWFGTQEMHLFAEGVRGALAFAAAFAVCLAVRRGRLSGWLSPLNVAPFLGSALFVAVDYVPATVAYYRQFSSELPSDFVALEMLRSALRVVAFGLVTLMIVRCIVRLASWCERQTRSEAGGLA